MADEQTEETPSTDLERLLSETIEKINQDAISWDDLKALIAQDPAALPVPAPSLPAVITPAQRKALERLPEVFGKVSPAEVRAVEPQEITDLLDERQTLATIKGLVEARMTDGIRTIILNHNDKVFERDATEEQIKETPKDKEGHYIVGGKHPGTPGENDKQFSVETGKGTVVLDPNALQALAADEDEPWFTHKDYIAMTTQTRVFDEAKVMLLLKKKPNLVRAVQKATKRGHGRVSVYERKA